MDQLYGPYHALKMHLKGFNRNNDTYVYKWTMNKLEEIQREEDHLEHLYKEILENRKFGGIDKSGDYSERSDKSPILGKYRKGQSYGDMNQRVSNELFLNQTYGGKGTNQFKRSKGIDRLMLNKGRSLQVDGGSEGDGHSISSGANSLKYRSGFSSESGLSQDTYVPQKKILSPEQLNRQELLDLLTTKRKMIELITENLEHLVIARLTLDHYRSGVEQTACDEASSGADQHLEKARVLPRAPNGVFRKGPERRLQQRAGPGRRRRQAPLPAAQVPPRSRHGHFLFRTLQHASGPLAPSLRETRQPLRSGVLEIPIGHQRRSRRTVPKGKLFD